MKRVLTGFVLILFTALVIYLRQFNKMWFALFATGIGVICVTELIRAFSKQLSKSLKILAIVLSVAILPIFFFFKLDGVFLSCILFFMIALTIMTFNTDIKFESIGIFSFIIFYPILIISLMIDLSVRADGLLPLLMIFLIGPCADTMAFVVGSKVGGKKLCPKVSPNKTISGFFGGIFGGVAASILIYFIFNSIVYLPLIVMIAIGFIGSCVTVVGDLAESSIKRRLKIKDFGNILPGHGGMLDRVDSILYNTVYIFIVFQYIMPIFY